MSKLIALIAVLSLIAAPAALAKDKEKPQHSNGNQSQSSAGNGNGKSDNGAATTAPSSNQPEASTVNQGDPDKVFQVSSGLQCDGAPQAGTKVEGGLGQTINVAGSPAIAYVSIKSGRDASLVSSSFSGDFSTGTITISKDVSNYVIYSCTPPTASVPPITPQSPPVPPTPPTPPVAPPVPPVAPPVPPTLTPPVPPVVPPVAPPAEVTPPVTPADICKNLAGVQTKAPKGTTRKNGNCVKVAVKGKKKATKPDMCRNLKGAQGKVPPKMVRKHGNCLKVAVKGKKVAKPKQLPYTP